MKKNCTFFLLPVLVFCILACGCVETGTKSVSEEKQPLGYVYTEHTYLYGQDGLFTKTYDLRIWKSGSDIITADGISGAEMNDYIVKYMTETTPAPVPATATVTATPVEVQTVSAAITTAAYSASTEIVHPGIYMAGTPIEVVGDVFGMSDDETYIDTVAFTIALSPGVYPVDFSKVEITFDNPPHVTQLKRDPDIGAKPIAGKWSVTEVLKDSGGDDWLLEEGEQFRIQAMPVAKVHPDASFQIDIRPPEGQVLSVTRTAPAVIEKVNIVY